MTSHSEAPIDAKGNPRRASTNIWQLFALLMAIVGQIIILNKTASNLLGVLFFCLAILILIGSLYRSPEFELAPPSPTTYFNNLRPLTPEHSLRLFFLIASLAAMVIAFWGFADNDLMGGLYPWIAAIAFFLIAFLEIPDIDKGRWTAELRIWWQQINKLHLIIIIAITSLAIFFRFNNLSSIPGEMTSDHAEKLQDVQDVLDGMRPIFFGRNTGREGFQFYLTALLIRSLPLQVNQLALQVGTGIFGVIAIPFTYLLGKELYNQYVGFIASFFLAISHWHVAITRVGLRFPFTAAFATPAIFFFYRALQRNNRNDWLAAGFFLGLGLHTYTAMRIVPVIFFAITGVKLVFDVRKKYRGGDKNGANSLNRPFWINAILCCFITLLLFLPLLRFSIDEPESFWFRIMSRATNGSQELSEGYLKILTLNIKNVLLMFNYQGDVVPINTIPDTPALGIITGASFVLGIVYLFWRLFRWRDRRSVYLLIIFFLLLTPSILSLSFPQENPSFVRTGGAVGVVMIIAALPFAIIIKGTFSNPEGIKKVLTLFLLAMLALGAVAYNYVYYFEWYAEHTLRSLWNATEIGDVLLDFQDAGGQLKNAYHIPYPHWVDTRNIGINAGDPYWANILDDSSDLEEHKSGARPRIYILFPDDQNSRQLLDYLFPDGQEEMFDSQREGKDFIIFRVP